MGLGGHSVLGPATCCEPGKRPGPPPAAVEGQTVKSRRRVTGQRRPLLHRAIRCKKLTRDQSDQARSLEESDLADPNRKVMVKNAAARRATRRLPLGEPPLVITTHAITSFRSSLPEPAGDQPRAGAGSSPSCHGSTTRKSAERVFGSERHINLASKPAWINSQLGKARTWPPGEQAGPWSLLQPRQREDQGAWGPSTAASQDLAASGGELFETCVAPAAHTPGIASR